ncbi:hypothetical protein [Kocuria sp. CH-021]|uniref:hypothetical protein n=1 Tax=Kocuria sp. CH-021 TaxID=3406735 RepID=UPI000DD2B77C
MTAKTFTLITFGGFIAMALFSLVVVLVGGDWRGGNDDVFWFQFAGAALTFGAYGMYRQKWSPKITGARYLLAVERDLTLDEAAEICQKYSFLLLISAGLFLVSGVAAIFVY